MFDWLGGGVIGSLLGGVFRLAPELMKFLDKKNERSHELAMFDKQCEMEKVRGQIRLDEIGAQRDMSIDTGMMAAFKSVIDQQTEMVKSAGGWVASLSASVRPIMTYYILMLYGLVKTAQVVLAINAGMELKLVLALCWTPDDMALMCGIINYWILDRSLIKRGLA